MTVLAGGDLALPAGIQWSDLAWISSRVLAIALIITVIGFFTLKRLAARSVALMITIVVAVSSYFASPTPSGAGAVKTSPQRLHRQRARS